ncbi:hypothetical protein NQ314_001624 [Rhamnusium bicolor]|uniref:RNA helicase n=1 Tax=Rhamnusium bicolor TaxID=1586634 RepID=A0AAV8ZSY4_9CUCU|nr:hypothetical protein NQ314_001624 [Rhamnusium bicolor]
MWRNIFSYFWKSGNELENELSLEGACNVLEEQTAKVHEHESSNILKKSDLDVNKFSMKRGIITNCVGNEYVIDDLYTFSTDVTNFTVGSRVSYNCFICDSKENIVNVRLIENDWDLEDTNHTLWNTRIIICKVEKRVNRNLLLSPGDITVDLNNVCIEFLPIVGDWLELDIKCSINENVIDLSGQLIEINKISPVRPHIEMGIVTKWDSSDAVGIVNKSIFFNQHSLSCGFIPTIGDKVIVEIIESDQNRCSWRALKVLPECVSKKLDNFNKAESNIPKFTEDYPGLHIDSSTLSFNRLNEHQPFIVTVSNTSEDNFVLIKAEFFKSNSQCKLLDKIDSYMLLRDTSFQISCECTARNIGISNELLLLYFENFNIGRWISINVSVNFKEPTKYFECKSSFPYQEKSENELVRGQRITAPPRFIATRIPIYTVPQKLLDTVSKYDFKDRMMLVEELKFVKPSLFSNLTYTNYEDKFHALLHLDEITNLIMIRNYDQEKACFIPSEDFLMLEIENLSERRPSIVLGDKVIASDPLNRNKLDFEGFIHKVGAKHIYIKFSQLFHDTYNGEDYSVKIIPGRSSYRRLHHAIYLAVRNLGQDILFPTRVYENDPQVNFVLDETSSFKSNHSVSGKKRMNPREVLIKLSELNKSHGELSNVTSKITDNLEPENESKLKLQWYNKKLNSKQKDAVINVLKGTARPLPYIIFGPPGTGKTVTIIELVLQIVRLIPQSRLLITAPSNSASDLIAMRLIESGVLKPGDMVRLVSHNYALSDLIPINLVPYCAVGSFAKDGTTDNEVYNSKIQYAGQLYAMNFPKGHFSHIIVDEAAQASEPEVLIPLAFLDKSSGQVVLAGDPMQLGPVVLCKISAECGLNDSYLERLISRFPYLRDPDGFPNNNGYDPRLVTKLLHNYRSLPAILKLSSSLFYNDELIATIDGDTSKEAVFVNNLKDILPKTNLNKTPHLVFHGVNGVNYQTADSPSWYNPHEAAQVFYYINELYRMELTFSQIGIITPYIKQVKEIRSLLTEAEFDIPKIGTVEEFQGQEFDVIILSTVRSCEEFISSDIIHSLGFVTSPRRLNVAISRSKALLIIIGNPSLLCFDIYWRSVIKYCFENGGYMGCDFSF